VITSINANNFAEYRSLFNEAADILTGYRRVRTYSQGTVYFYKNDDATDEASLFVPVTSTPEDFTLEDFTDWLEKKGILYVNTDEEGRVMEKAKGFHPMIGITSIEEYFSWLKVLGRTDRKYTVLPLDEPHFEIDANTRVIKIPVDFKKNGVAVQGDDLAEVLYFKVDRYFDYMDLNNCDIFIQWETPKNSKGEVFKSASPAYIRDIESEPGKLIFGWILDEAITAIPGNLKFSVRFYQWNNKESAIAGVERVVDYSLSTLTAQVAIQPSINFNIETDDIILEDAGDRLIERIGDTIVVGGYHAAAPMFIINLLDTALEKKEYDEGTSVSDKNNNVIFNGLTFEVQAYAPDTGSITYRWKKQFLNDDNSVEGQDIITEDQDERLKNKNIYVGPIDKTKYDARLDYWIPSGDDHIRFEQRGGLTEAQLADPDFNLYERHASCDIITGPDGKDYTGVYWCEVENRMTNATKKITTGKAKLLRPKAVKIVTPPVQCGIIRDGKCELKVVVEEADNLIQKKSYQWLKDDNSELNFGNEEPVFVEIPGATEPTLDVASLGEGHYKVIAYNTRNGYSKNDTPDYVTRVTNPAEQPKPLPYPSEASKQFIYSALTEDNCPYIVLDESVRSDEYSIKWYHFEFGESTLIAEYTLEKGVYSDSFNPKAYEDQIKEATGAADIDGSYYAIVTNNLNGDLASTDMPLTTEMFTVVY
jgi:hypothetical protein